MRSIPRVAFFTDSFHEINGVAHTSRHFDAFARRRRLPFLNVHAGEKTALVEDGPVWTLELHRSSFGFALERDMSFDLLLMRHRQKVAETMKKFGADLVHITGPSDIGIMGAYMAHHLRLPLIASWHTNIHEFGGRRLKKVLSFLADQPRGSFAGFAERNILSLSANYYRLARVLLAPNVELVEMLQQRTARPVFLMQRGVDTALFSPDKRDRSDDVLTIGYVGRLSPEKSVRVLSDVEKALEKADVGNFRILIVGEGHEQPWLAANVRRAEFTGVLRGEELARAYANMDLFAFPSHTDTFGNVVLEALSSAVPVVVTASGGPKYIVNPGVTGLVAADDQAFLESVASLAQDQELLQRMSVRAREYALCKYWDRIFDRVYDTYEYCLRTTREPGMRQAVSSPRKSFA